MFVVPAGVVSGEGRLCVTDGASCCDVPGGQRDGLASGVSLTGTVPTVTAEPSDLVLSQSPFSCPLRGHTDTQTTAPRHQSQFCLRLARCPWAHPFSVLQEPELPNGKTARLAWLSG